MQNTRFPVKGSLKISIINYGSRNITPTIITDSSMTITKDDIEYAVEAGETKDYRFELGKSENVLTIVGNGTIEFKFKVEVL